MEKSILVLLMLCIVTCLNIQSAYAASNGFTNPIKVSGKNTDSQEPQAVISENGISAVWVETSFGRSDIFFAKSIDGGITFGSPKILSASSLGQSAFPAIAQNGNYTYVVWQSSNSLNSTIFFTKSSNGGSSFENPLRISQGSNSAFPQIAVSGSHVYSTWIEKSVNESTNIVITSSPDAGKSFVTPIQITHHAGNSGIPKIISTGAKVYLVWEDNSNGNFQIFLSKSRDYGATFETPHVLSNTIGQSGTPQMFVSDNNIYAVWMSNPSGNYDVMFAKSTDDGKSFSRPVDISNTKLDSGYPQFTVSGNNIYVTWTETISDTNYDVLFAKSTDTGSTFDKPINLSSNLGESGWPQIAYDGNVYVSWVDNSTGNFDVFITKSSDGGKIFQTPVNISNTEGESYYDTMLAYGNTVSMIWQEYEQGKHDIVFSKSTTFVPEFGTLAAGILMMGIFSILIFSRTSKMKSLK